MAFYSGPENFRFFRRKNAIRFNSLSPGCGVNKPKDMRRDSQLAIGINNQLFPTFGLPLSSDRSGLSVYSPKPLMSPDSDFSVYNLLAAARLKTKMLTEKRQHMILEAIGHFTRVRALIHFKAVRDSVPVEDFVQLAGVGA